MEMEIHDVIQSTNREDQEHSYVTLANYKINNNNNPSWDKCIIITMQILMNLLIKLGGN